LSISAETNTFAPRKFTAPTSRQALRLAREALGESAMVLASRRLDDGFEITALAEEQTESLVQSAVPATQARASASPHAPSEMVLSEIHSLRSMVEERLGSIAWNDQQRRNPVRGRMLGEMLGAGFSARLSKAMLERLPEGQGVAEGEAWVKSELLRNLLVLEDEAALLRQGGVYALVGPTGVGKTTTTAKLAARCVEAFGAENIALVTTDTYRIGAIQQLQIYGQLMNVPVYAVQDTAGLQAVLGQLRDKHVVLVDTEGRSQRDRAVSNQIAMLGGTDQRVKRLLLLNAASHGDTLNEVVHAYQNAPGGSELVGCIFTKMDEAPCYGALLDVVIRHRLPVYYLSNGQKVPENLATVDAARVVNEVFQARGTLFTCDPGVIDSQPAARAAAPKVADPEPESQRLRAKYERLIRALAHDAQELADAARALDVADVGFAAARHLWNQAQSCETSRDTVQQQLLALARVDVATLCDSHVLALCGRSRLDPSDSGDSFELQSSLLLSDRSGRPLAAPNQWLCTGVTRRPGARQIEWLREQQFDRPVVHLLPRLAPVAELARWHAQGQRWLARAVASDCVVDGATGASLTLGDLALTFGPPQATTHHGKPALACEADMSVGLRTVDGAQLAVRCIARRVLAMGGKRVLDQSLMLTNLESGVSSTQIAQWHVWGVLADSCLRLTSKGLSLLGGIGAPGDPSLPKRVLVAGQVATTAWRLLNEPGARAERTRMLIAELAGRQVRPDRAVSGNVMYEGLVKLFHLLEALEPDSDDAELEERS
jgi:flagellar biosynthesis protein FlhF